MIKSFYLTILLFMITQLAYSQSIEKVNGQVQNEKKEPIVGAIVILSKAKTDRLIKSTFTDVEGKFEFEKLIADTCKITVSYIGFQQYINEKVILSTYNYSHNLGVILLTETAKNLREVTVKAQKSFVEKKIDRVVINPDALIGNAGTTSLEILEKAPGVQVDVNGLITLKGKSGVVVFVDDKPTYLATADLAGYLRSLSAGSVESIEIMTNPPAKYDASGNAGVINIKLKKNQLKGLNGVINLGYGKGRYARTNNSVNFNYRVNKFNFFTNASVNQNNTYQDLTINRLYYTPEGAYSSAFRQNSYIKRQLGSNNLKLGLDYYVSKKSTLGLVLNGFYNPTFVPTTNKARILNQNNQVVSIIEAISPNDRKWKNGSVNLNHTLKIDSLGKELATNFDVIQYISTQDQQLTNTIFTPERLLVGQTVLGSSLPAEINIKTAKIDYINPLKRGAKLETGFKTSFIKTDNTADFFDVLNSQEIPNYEFSNRFKYNENINAAYVNYSKNWKRLSLQAGLRYENTSIKGNQLGNKITKDSTFTRTYNSLFPTFYLQYKLDSTQRHQLGFSAGRRIGRPNYQDLNPFTYPLDRYTYYGGNPFLQPTYSYNLEVSHTYKNFLTTSLEYSISKNLIFETNEQRGTIYYSRPGNFGEFTSYGISVNGNFTINKWWTLQIYTELKNQGYNSKVYGQILDENRFYWYVGPTNQFKINKKLSAELAGNYQTKVLAGQFLTIPVWSMRAGISQKIFKDKGTFRINVSDIFYTNQPGGDIRNIANAKANWLSYLDSRVLTFSFAYRFSKGKTLNARQSGGSESEKSRVKL
jgi:outer membrane receptor protein involved in Fe transport